MDIIELSKKIETITNDELYDLFKDGFKVFPQKMNIFDKLTIGKGYVLHPNYLEIVHTGDGWVENDLLSTGGTGTFHYKDIISIDIIKELPGWKHRNGQIKVNTHTTGKGGIGPLDGGSNDPFRLFFNPNDGPVVSSLKKVLLHIMENPIQNPNKVVEQTNETPEDKGVKTTSENKKSEVSVIEQIKELKELLDMGILTDDEFQSKKKELLEKL